MSGSILNVYIVTVVTVLCPCIVFSIPLISGGNASLHQLTFRGSIEGKSYFAEGNLSVTWPEANSYCNSSGMHLATFTSVAQTTLLHKTFNNVPFAVYWTGGRDSRKPSQFSWSYNDEIANSTVVTPLHPPLVKNCLVFDPHNNEFFGFECQEFKFKILCELIH